MKKQKVSGSVLGVVLMLTMLLAIITAVVASNTLQNYKTTNWATDAGTSRYIAFAGLQHAMLKLRDEPKFNDSFDGKVPGRPELSYHVTVRNQRDLVATTSGPKGAPTTTWTNPFSTAEIPVDAAKIEAQVIMTNGQVERTLSGMVGTAIWKPTGFVNAASARSAVIMQGASKTMAFDFLKYKDDKRSSQSTAMDSGYVDPLSPSTTKEDGAHVQTNDLMQIGDTSKAEGDVLMRDTSTDTDIAMAEMAALRDRLKEAAPDLAAALPSKAVAPTATVNYTGTKKQAVSSSVQPSKAPYKPAEAIQVLTDFPAKTETVTEEYTDKKGDKQTRTVTKTTPQTLPIGAYKSITVPAGQTLRLTAGQYYVSDEFKVDGTIEFVDEGRGEALFFVGKKMTVNGDVNFNGDPGNLQLYFTDEDKPLDKLGLPILTAPGFSSLNMNPGGRGTMVASGAGLITRIDGARLLGAVTAEAVWLKNKASIEYDTNLKGRQMAGGSCWKLQGVYETVGR